MFFLFLGVAVWKFGEIYNENICVEVHFQTKLQITWHLLEMFSWKMFSKQLL